MKGQLGMKKCPYCAGEVKEGAFVCSFCGRDFIKTFPLHQAETEIPREQAKQKIKMILFVAICFVICAVGAALFILLWDSY